MIIWIIGLFFNLGYDKSRYFMSIRPWKNGHQIFYEIVRFLFLNQKGNKIDFELYLKWRTNRDLNQNN